MAGSARLSLVCSPKSQLPLEPSALFVESNFELNRFG